MRADTMMMEFKTITLDKLRLNSRNAIASYVLANADSELHMDAMSDRMIFELQSHVLQDKTRSYHKTWTVVEEPVHEDWKHQLVTGLPEGFRRRFLCFLWDIPLDYAGKRVTHEVVVDVPAVFPECERYYPKELGPIHFPVHVEPRYGWN